MRLLLAIILALTVLAVPVPAAAAGVSSARSNAENGGITSIGYNVPAGTDRPLLFQTGAQGPLKDIQFVFGGNSDALRIKQIAGRTNDDPYMTFSDASPWEATVFFVQNWQPPVQSTDFIIYVDNSADRAQHLQITVRWK